MTAIVLILAVTGLVALLLHSHITRVEAIRANADAEVHDIRIKAELASIFNDRPEAIISTADSEYDMFKVEWPKED